MLRWRLIFGLRGRTDPDLRRRLAGSRAGDQLSVQDMGIWFKALMGDSFA